MNIGNFLVSRNIDYVLGKKNENSAILHYPKSYTRLRIDQLKNIETISSDVETELSETIAFSLPYLEGQFSIENKTLTKICTAACFCTYIDKCIIYE